MGGMRNWSQVESIRLKGTIEREGQIVDIVIIKKRPNQIRATVTLPIPGKDDQKLQVIRAHDGKTAWTATRLAGAETMTREELPREAAEELLADAGVLPRLIKLWREGAELTLLESREFEGQPAIAVQSSLNGNLLVFYLSSEDYTLMAYESHHSAGGVTRTRLKDYVTESGIKIPVTNIIESPKTGTSRMTTESIEVGVGIYEEYFDIGESLQTARSK